jgi:hypothetical protein
MADSRHGGSLEADTADRRQGTRVVFSPIRKSGLTESVYQRLRSGSSLPTCCLEAGHARRAGHPLG